MIAEQDCVNANANLRFKYNNVKNKTQKRMVRTASLNGPRAKKHRGEADFGEISNSMGIDFTQGLRSLNQLNDENIQKVEKLQRDLVNTNIEKQALLQKNAELIGEKMALEKTHCIEMKKIDDEKKTLERKAADADEAKRKAEEMFDDAKKELMEKIAALKMAQLNEKKNFDDEKDALEQRIVEFERNKNKNTCAHCQKFVDSLAFCNDECVV